MDISELKDRIYRATGNRYTDFVHMLQLINDALTDLTDEAKLEDAYQVDVIKGQDTYALPSNYKSFRSLVDQTTITDFYQPYPLIDITENKFGCVVFNGNLIIRPIPTVNATLKLYYYKFPTELVNDTDIPDIDTHYHNLLSSYAIMMILPLMENQNSNQMQQYVNIWTTGKQQFIGEMQKKRKLSRVRESITW